MIELLFLSDVAVQGWRKILFHQTSLARHLCRMTVQEQVENGGFEAPLLYILMSICAKRKSNSFAETDYVPGRKCVLTPVGSHIAILFSSKSLCASLHAEVYTLLNSQCPKFAPCSAPKHTSTSSLRTFHDYRSDMCRLTRPRHLAPGAKCWGQT